jgi:FKBP12-rapamycin complex-associated protein
LVEFIFIYIFIYFAIGLQDTNPRVASCVLATLGELATVGGADMTPHIPQLLPLIIETLQDQSSAVKREVALRTLGQLAESAGTTRIPHTHEPHTPHTPHSSLNGVRGAGYVIEPFIRYPKLLEILINEIKTEQGPSIRREVVKVLGTLGALDPYKHKTIQIEVRQEKNLVAGAGDGVGGSAHQPPHEVSGMGSEEYYLTVSVGALMKILRDPSLAQVITRHTAHDTHGTHDAHGTTRA